MGSGGSRGIPNDPNTYVVQLSTQMCSDVVFPMFLRVPRLMEWGITRELWAKAAKVFADAQDDHVTKPQKRISNLCMGIPMLMGVAATGVGFAIGSESILGIGLLVFLLGALGGWLFKYMQRSSMIRHATDTMSAEVFETIGVQVTAVWVGQVDIHGGANLTSSDGRTMGLFFRRVPDIECGMTTVSMS